MLTSEVLRGVAVVWMCSCGASTAFAAPPQLVVPLGHVESVYFTAWSPDGELLATADNDSVVKLWDVKSGRLLRTFGRLQRRPSALTFTRDGGEVLAASYLEVAAWDVSTGAPTRTIPVGGGEKAFSPDLKSIAVGEREGKLELGPLAAQKRSVIGRFKPEIDGVRYSPDGSRLAVQLEDDHILLIGVKTKHVERKLSCPDVSAYEFSPDGKRLVCTGSHVRLFDVSSGKALRTRADDSSTFAFAPDGKTLTVFRFHSATLERWDAKTLETLTARPIARPAWCASLTFDTTGTRLAAGMGDGSVRIFDALGLSEQILLQEGGARIREMAASRDGQHLAIGRTAALELWSPATHIGPRLTIPDVKTEALLFNPAGTKVAVKGEIDTEIIDVASGSRARIGFLGDKPAAFSEDGTVLLTRSHGQVDLWSMTSLERIGQVGWSHKTAGLVSPHDDIHGVAISPDHKTIACASANPHNSASMFLVDLATNAVVRSFADREADGSIRGFGRVAISPDGRRIAAALFEGGSDLFLFDSALTLIAHTTNKEVGDRFMPSSLAFSTDGTKIVMAGGHTAASAQPIVVYDGMNGQLIRTLRGHVQEVRSAEFLPNGRIVSGSYDGTIHIWDPQAGARLGTLAMLTRPSPTDWVAVSASGQFDGTEAGIGQLSFVSGVEPISLDAFFEQLYAPKLWSRLWSGERLAAPPETVIDVTRSIKPPPGVRITQPGSDVSVATAELELLVEAVDRGGGVDEVRLFQNGKVVSTDGARGFKRPLTGSVRGFRVQLVPGPNVFKAVAFSSERVESTPSEITVTLTGNASESSLFVLAVGINAYQNPKYRLNYGRPDAEAFAKALAKAGSKLFNSVNVTVLVDEAASHTGIANAFASIRARATASDAFVFYYAGHGAMSEAEAGKASELYLPLADVRQLYGDNPELVRASLAAAQLRDFATSIAAQKQLIVIDACQSGGALDTFASRGAAEERAMAQLARSAGIVVLAAAQSEQLATEYAALGHGVFTYALLKGLAGSADRGKDGKITVKELEAYLNDEVPELTKRYRGTAQYPTSFAKGQDFPLALP